MTKSSRLEWEGKTIEGSPIEDVGNRFRLKKEIDDTTVKDIRNHFRLKKRKSAIKDRIIRDIRNLFEHKEAGYCKPVRVSNS